MPSQYRQVTLDRDHARPRHQPAATDAALETRLTRLVGPACAAVGDAARGLGVRNRQLTLPLMVAAVLTLIWRQVPSVSELGRVLEREDVLGQARRHVSQQALSLRRRCLPASLFGQVLTALLPVLHARAQRHYAHIWAIDGTTLEPVFHKVGLTRPTKGTTQPGGKVEAVLDAVTKLPVALWLDDDAHANDLRFVDRLHEQLTAPTLLLADAQYISARADLPHQRQGHNPGRAPVPRQPAPRAGPDHPGRLPEPPVCTSRAAGRGQRRWRAVAPADLHRAGPGGACPRRMWSTCTPSAGASRTPSW